MQAKNMRKRFLQLLSDKFQDESKWLLAVSGGVDSMVMWDLCRYVGLNYAIAHCNFGLRGDESDSDAALVAREAQLSGVQCFQKYFPETKERADEGLSVQLLARQLRYDFFHELADKEGFSCIATAHHLGDSMETFLYGMAKGMSISGLRGVPERSGNIIRPLIGFSKSEISAYAEKYRIPWREDRSNQSDKYKRNFIRHHLIPKLQELNPDLSGSYADTRERLSATADLVDDLFEERRQRHTQQYESGEVLIRWSAFREKHVLLFLYEFLKDYGFSYRQCRQISKAEELQTGRELQTGNYRLIREREGLLLTPKTKSDFSEVIITEDVFRTAQHKPAVFETPFGSVCVKILPPGLTPVFGKDPKQVFTALKKEHFPITLRRAQKGDRMQPFGMQGSKSISDMLTDAKVPKHKKEKALLLCAADGTILWLVGMRLSEQVRLKKESGMISEWIFMT